MYRVRYIDIYILYTQMQSGLFKFEKVRLNTNNTNRTVMLIWSTCSPNLHQSQWLSISIIKSKKAESVILCIYIFFLSAPANLRPPAQVQRKKRYFRDDTTKLTGHYITLDTRYIPLSRDLKM